MRMEDGKMHVKHRVWVVFLAGLLVLPMVFFGSCQKPTKKYTTHSFAFFDTMTTVMGYAENQAEFDRIAGEILAELEEYHKLFTIYESYEGLANLYTVNERVNGVHQTVTVDRRIIDMLLFAKEMYTLTEGKVNVAMGSVLSFWHTYRQDGMRDPSYTALPPKECLSAASAHTDIDKVHMDLEHNTVTLTDPEMTLDVGAIAKGYAVEMVADSLEQRGITGYLLNVGGNVRSIGAKGNGEDWVAGIQDPDPDRDEPIAYVMLRSSSLVTSGSYQRYYVVDGISYHHIIDPETQMPAEGYTSVSVLCESAALGDALSTALFCMTLEEGRALVDTLDGVEALWITTDGQCHPSNGFFDDRGY